MSEVIPILSWIVFGLITGLIAQFLMSTRHTGNFWISLLLGAVGALVGGLLGRLVFGFGASYRWQSPEDLWTPSYILSLLFAVLGAIVFDAAYRIAIDRKTADGE
jgi:Predicted membrane protein